MLNAPLFLSAVYKNTYISEKITSRKYVIPALKKGRSFKRPKEEDMKNSYQFISRLSLARVAAKAKTWTFLGLFKP